MSLLIAVVVVYGFGQIVGAGAECYKSLRLKSERVSG